jgi:phospholipase C
MRSYYLWTLGLALAGCGGAPSGPPDDADAAAKRTACEYGAGALVEETHGRSQPDGRTIPVDHVLVLMQENRSFDHYFQKLPEHGQPDVDVAPDDFSNPDPDGKPVPIFHDTAYCFLDTSHSWGASHRQYDNGKMDGFVVTSHGKVEETDGLPPMVTEEMLGGERAMAYYDATDLPYYYDIASEFSIADRYFSSVLGPTWPNRMFLYAASSYGITSNVPSKADRTLFDELDAAAVDFAIYADEQPGIAVFAEDLDQYKDHVRPLAAVRDDIENGTLPAVAFVDPILGNHDHSSIDEHPPAMAPIGQAHIAGILNALMESPLWSRSVAFLVYDEHGGLWDHVPPPQACIPDEHRPILPGNAPGEFDRYGFRVPLIAVSPFAKQHHVSHHIYDHTSLVRFIEARFGLPAMTRRDANAEVPWDMFDFEGKPHASPPSFPIPTPDPAKVEICAKVFKP